jgi:hypothetical protein
MAAPADRPRLIMLNPEPDSYRPTEVCLVCGGDTAYPALLVRRQPALARFRTRMRDAHSWHVQPFMTWKVLAAVMGEMTRAGLRARWDGDVAVIRDTTAGPAGERRLAPDEHGLYAVGAFESVGSYDWTWAEIVPPWPGPDADARAIVGLLTAPVPNSWPIANQIRAKAGIHALAGALSATADVAARERICHLLGQRDRGDAALAIPALLALLHEPHAGLRSEAADAIGQIALREGRAASCAAAHDAGAIVAAALIRERDPRTRALLASALGALDHEPSIPQLIALLGDDEWLVRREAAAALGALRAAEAGFSLERALARERDGHAAEAMRVALATITGRPATERSGAIATAPLVRVAGGWSPGGVRSPTSADLARGLPAESS